MAFTTAMDRRPFEIIAECEMTGFPTGADIGRLRERIESARRSQPGVVRALVNPPPIYKERRYVLLTRFVVWAVDGVRAVQAVAELLQDAAIACRTVLPSGRALTDAEVPPLPKSEESGPATKRPRMRATSRSTRTRGNKQQPVSRKRGRTPRQPRRTER